MSSILPKRISEMPSIDSDIDSPDKFTENVYSKNAKTFPKRIADLNIPEYDSDDDKNDKLNCAILNDSFVLSPSKDIEYPDTPVEKPKLNKPLEENNRNVSIFTHDSGFMSRFNTLNICSSSKEVVQNANAKENEEPPISNRPIKSRTQLFPPSVKAEKLIPSIFQHQNKDQSQREEPVKAPSSNTRMPFSNIRVPLSTKKEPETPLETPFKNNEQQLFVTPSARPFPSASMINSLVSSTATCERDSNKRKIVFTTPSARLFSGPDLITPSDTRLQPHKLSPIKEPSEEKVKVAENILTINKIEYEIGRKIGSGGSSSVFLAKGRKSGKECAIKLVNLDADPQTVEGYINETKLLAKLQGNINVVALYDYCHMPSKKTLYMVMEKGESDLHKILQGFTGHIPLYTLMNYWYQMLQAVNYIHQNGVIHSDLKPANFLMIQGRLKLIDFGIASNIALESTSIIKFTQAGTFNYISPEALIDTSTGDSPSTHHQPRIRLSTKSDVWSLGCILYLLLYKKTPFSHIKTIPAKVSAITSPVTEISYPQLPNFYPSLLLEMLKKCLVYNPKERSSVADLLKHPFDMIIQV